MSSYHHNDGSSFLFFFFLTLLFQDVERDIFRKIGESSGRPAPTTNKVLIGWVKDSDGDITMPISLKTIGNAGYRDQ